MSTSATQRTFLGHPLGLYVLFFTEMWERFSYYGMRALLMLYMLNYFRWEQKDAATIYKVYTSFVYITPIIGGFLADRYLGNRWAVIIGAILMTIGHFLMAFEEYPIFIAALIVLILGNGMFKPNMSIQVGRLYPANDGRLDAAYTIFYMGINLGAFLSPIACGWLRENTVGGYHSGFTLAGIGMLVGLLTYLLGQPLIKEIKDAAPDASPVSTTKTSESDPEAPLSEEQAAKTPSVLGAFSALLPMLLAGAAVAVIAAAPTYYFLKPPADRGSAVWDAIMLGIGGVCLGLFAFVCSRVVNAVRDRVVTILILGVFVMFFWAAYEQAGNVLNVWADTNTDRNMTRDVVEPAFTSHLAQLTTDRGEVRQIGVWDRFATMFTLKDRPSETWGQWFENNINPVPTEWFQSINALAIFVLAPIFAWLWIWLDRRKMQPSIALKMFFGLVLMSLSVVVMIQAARQEDQVSRVRFAGPLPAGIVEKDGVLGFTNGRKEFEPFQAGRLKREGDALMVKGVLADTEFERIVARSAPAEFGDVVESLAEKSEGIDDKNRSVAVTLRNVPNDFSQWMAKQKNTVVQFDPKSGELTAFARMKERETLALRFFAAEPAFARSMSELSVESKTFRVSSLWLLVSYILATLGELCLSPVGLSMVSKLAPTAYATMLMGVWLLTSAFGNFAAGMAGEMWGTVPPVTFFTYLAGILAVAALVLLVLVRLVSKMMHNVK